MVANVRGSAIDVGPSLDCLARELEAGDQVVWVDAAGVGPVHGVDDVVAGTRPSRGHLYAEGLLAARHPFVAFTDSATEVQPGWRSAAVTGLMTGGPVVGGPVLLRPNRPAITAACFFVEYGPHAVAPFTSASGDVSANNVAYRRAALDEVLGIGEPLWKSAVNTRLAGHGEPPVLVDGMRVVSTKTYGWSGIGSDRFQSGRLYGTQRAATWSPRRRLVRAPACAALPCLAYARLARRIGADKDLRASFALCTPLVLMALTAWSMGEAWGYLMTDGTGDDVF